MEQSKFYQIKNITEYEYTLVCCDGSVITRPIQDIDKSASVFNIQDAKDGDVCASGQVIFIFKKIHDGGLYCHCTRHNDGSFIADSYGLMTYKYFGEVHPATKEQHDTLMKAMANAGYIFDFDKKELKKIKWHPIHPTQWNISNYRTWQYIVSDVLTKHDGIGQYLDDGFCKEIAKYMQEEWSKKLSPELNIAWSVEDEDMLDNIIDDYDDADEHNLVDDIGKVMWLKALKDRVTPQPKQEWSEEDEKIVAGLNNCIDELEEVNGWRFTYVNDENVELTKVRNWLKLLKERVACEANCTTTKEWSEDEESIINKAKSWLDTLCDYLKDSSPEYISDIKDVINKLKSIKDKYTWKPSSIQMECLHDAIEHYHTNGYPASKLTELYEQLSKIYKL